MLILLGLFLWWLTGFVLVSVFWLRYLDMTLADLVTLAVCGLYGPLNLILIGWAVYELNHHKTLVKARKIK